MGTDRPNVSILAIASAAPTEWQQGLIGWLTLQVDEILVLDGIALRQAWDGRMVLSYPARRDRRGRQHPLVRPLDDQTRRVIEEQVFKALGIAEEAAS